MKQFYGKKHLYFMHLKHQSQTVSRGVRARIGRDREKDRKKLSRRGRMCHLFKGPPGENVPVVLGR